MRTKLVKEVHVSKESYLEIMTSIPIPLKNVTQIAMTLRYLFKRISHVTRLVLPKTTFAHILWGYLATQTHTVISVKAFWQQNTPV